MKKSKLSRKRILFYCGPNGKTEWMYRVAKEIEETYSTKSFFLAYSQYDIDFLKSVSVNSKDIHLLEPLPKLPSKYKQNIELLKNNEIKYGFNVWDIWTISSGRNTKRGKLPIRNILFYMEHNLQDSENIMKKFKPDIFVIYGPASFSTTILMKVAEANNIKIIEIQDSRIPEKFAICNDLKLTWPLLIQNYKKILKRRLTASEKRVAEKFIEDFVEKPKKPTQMIKYHESKKAKIKRYASYVKKVLWYRSLPPSLRFLFWPIIERYYDWFGYFEKPRKNERFALYPLHFNPEAATLIYGKWYDEQLELIGNISRSLPVDVKLYVKEHRMGYGNRNPSFYKKIKKLRNVRLIYPKADTFKLIKNSELVLTITGSTGWEALLFKKPVITFGEVHFNLFKPVIHNKSLENLPEEIRNALNSKPNNEDYAKLVYATLISTFDGVTRLPIDCNNYTLTSRENTKLIVKGIAKYVDAMF